MVPVCCCLFLSETKSQKLNPTGCFNVQKKEWICFAMHFLCVCMKRFIYKYHDEGCMTRIVLYEHSNNIIWAYYFGPRKYQISKWIVFNYSLNEEIWYEDRNTQNILAIERRNEITIFDNTLKVRWRVLSISLSFILFYFAFVDYNVWFIIHQYD